MSSEPRDLYHKEIVYDPGSRDFACRLDGELVGYARNYHEASVMLDQLVYELLTHNYFSEDNNAPAQSRPRDAQSDRVSKGR